VIEWFVMQNEGTKYAYGPKLSCSGERANLHCGTNGILVETKVPQAMTSLGDGTFRLR
jgi:hypothetical protein